MKYDDCVDFQAAIFPRQVKINAEYGLEKDNRGVYAENIKEE